MINKKETGEALVLCIELLEKAIPKKPKGVSLTHDGRVGDFPCCNKLVAEFDDKPNICKCGQRLDWNTKVIE